MITTCCYKTNINKHDEKKTSLSNFKLYEFTFRQPVQILTIQKIPRFILLIKTVPLDKG